MKKLLGCLLSIIIVFLVGGLASVHASQSIEVEGFVDVGSVVDNNELTTTFDYVTYTFNVTHADSFMNYISVEFESDVFASVGTVAPAMPGDWEYSLALSGSGSQYVMGNAGTEIGEGEQLVFVVEEVEVYNTALISDDPWQEGQAWGQSFVAGDTFGGADGGSTAIAIVPEPISSALFIIGALMMGLKVHRKKRAINS